MSKQHVTVADVALWLPHTLPTCFSRVAQPSQLCTPTHSPAAYHSATFNSCGNGDANGSAGQLRQLSIALLINPAARHGDGGGALQACKGYCEVSLESVMTLSTLMTGTLNEAQLQLYS